jgi:tetratricopeptide (TPR) repeat protein
LTEVTPADAAAWAQLGQLYGITRQFDKAHDAYRTAYEISRAPQALIGMASSDYELHRWAEAAAIFDALDKGAPDVLKASPQLYYVMGQVYQNSNQPAKAKLAYQRFLPFLKPNSSGATQVKKLIADLDKKPSGPSAKASAAPKKT